MKLCDLRAEMLGFGFFANGLRKIECVAAVQFIRELSNELVKQRVELSGEYYDGARGVYVAEMSVSLVDVN